MEFLLDNENKLKYAMSKIHEESYLLDENVMIFGYTYGKDDSTHLVYLQKNGALNYVLFKDGKINESLIGNFDTRSNSYNQIEILMIKDRINIFYSYSNVINANIYTIHHVIINGKDQEKYNIIRYVSKKKEKSFSVSNDSSGNIHLLYNTVSESFSHIYYTYFNPYKNQWLNSPTKLSSSDTISKNPTIMVDSKENIHCIFWDLKNESYSLRIKRMAQVGKDVYKWLDIKTPRVIEDSPMISISEKNHIIYIETDNFILLSEDYGLTYVEDSLFEENNPAQNNINSLENDLSKDDDLNNNLEKDLNDDDNIESALNELRESYQEIKEFNNENRLMLENLLLNEEDIRLKLNTLLEELALINSSINSLEEATRNPKSGLKKFFSLI